jgi:hypothetical protein
MPTVHEADDGYVDDPRSEPVSRSVSVTSWIGNPDASKPQPVRKSDLHTWLIAVLTAVALLVWIIRAGLKILRHMASFVREGVKQLLLFRDRERLLGLARRWREEVNSLLRD